MSCPLVKVSCFFRFSTRATPATCGACAVSCAPLVTNFPWDDRDLESRVAARKGAITLWRSCLPHAVACTFSKPCQIIPDDEGYMTTVICVQNNVLTDIDLALLRGIQYLDISNCTCLSDRGFRQLTNIHTLKMNGCHQDTITDAAFSHLTGIHTLHMEDCNQETITDAAFAHLVGIHTLRMRQCCQESITDAAFSHLTGIHTLDINWCDQVTITDAAFAHFEGIHNLQMQGCFRQVTDAAFAHLVGIHTLDISFSRQQFTDAAFAHLVGIHTLNIVDCRLTDAAFAHLAGIHT
jgi:hypothetical protein